MRPRRRNAARGIGACRPRPLSTLVPKRPRAEAATAPSLHVPGRCAALASRRMHTRPHLLVPARANGLRRPFAARTQHPAQMFPGPFGRCASRLPRPLRTICDADSGLRCGRLYRLGGGLVLGRKIFSTPPPASPDPPPTSSRTEPSAKLRRARALNNPWTRGLRACVANLSEPNGAYLDMRRVERGKGVKWGPRAYGLKEPCRNPCHERFRGALR